MKHEQVIYATRTHLPASRIHVRDVWDMDTLGHLLGMRRRHIFFIVCSDMLPHWETSSDTLVEWGTHWAIFENRAVGQNINLKIDTKSLILRLFTQSVNIQREEKRQKRGECWRAGEGISSPAELHRWVFLSLSLSLCMHNHPRLSSNTMPDHH